MNKGTVKAIKSAMAKEFGVKIEAVLFMESSGDIEYFNSNNYSEETFAIEIRTSRHIKLGFTVPVYGRKNAYTGKVSYTIDGGLIEKNNYYGEQY